MVLCQSLGRTQNAPEAANASGVFVFSEKGAAAWVGYLIFRFACGIIYKTYYGLLRLFSTYSSWKRRSFGKYVPTDMDECEASEEYGMSQAASKRIWLATPTMHGEEARRCPPPETQTAHNAEGRPIWKPMHMQPIYHANAFVAAKAGVDVGRDIFTRGLCLPSDIKMTEEEQDMVIQTVRSCFD